MTRIEIIENQLKKHGWKGKREETPIQIGDNYYFNYELSAPNGVIELHVEMDLEGNLLVDDSHWIRVSKNLKLRKTDS